MGDHINWDNVSAAPPGNDHSNANSGPDFSEARMGVGAAQFMRVGLPSQLSNLPNCDEILGMVNQMSIHNNDHLLDRMNQFTNGEMNTKGITFDQISHMMNSPNFSRADKQAIGTMQELFSSSSGRQGDSSRMTLAEFGMGLKAAMIQEQCPVPGMTQQPQGGGYGAPPPRRRM
jgi:hypothetical protein